MKRVTERQIMVNDYKYELIKEFNRDYDCITYGIYVERKIKDKVDSCYVLDVTSCSQKADFIFSKVSEHMVSPIHLKEVLSDLLSVL